MVFSADDLKMVDDHIALAERHVTRQEELVAFLKSRGHPTETAEQLLEEFRATLDQHRAHRKLMQFEEKVDSLLASAPKPDASRAPGSPKRG